MKNIKVAMITLLLIVNICIEVVGAVPTEEWNKTFGGPGNDVFYSVNQTSDGGYISVGTTSSYGTANVLLIKTDSLGNKQWSKTFGGVSRRCIFCSTN